MRVGLHLSIAKGLDRTAETAVRTVCQTIQIFSGNPTGWRPSNRRPADVQRFRLALEKADIGPVYIHAPYLVNLAAPNLEVWEKSVATLATALDFASSLGNAFVVTHVGSHVGTGQEAGVERVTRALAHLLEDPAGPTILLENSPGSRNELGSYFEEMTMILDRLPVVRPRLGVCLDTAHLWGAGYDLSTPRAVNRTLKLFDRQVGLGRLRGIHANDSTLDKGAHRDLHISPGQGRIGIRGFRALVHHPALADMNYILELPRLSDDECLPMVAEFKALTNL